MTVWIVMSGENLEGGGILGVFRELPNPEQVKSMAEPSLKNGWDLVRSGHWVCGPDWLSVHEHEVQEVE